MDLSNDQIKVLNNLLLWYSSKNKNQFITVGGYAGTGKTTLISIFRKTLYEKVNKKATVAFCSYTGRAVQVLKNSIIESKAKYPKDITSTIHGLIYSPIVNDKEEIVGWERKEELAVSLIILDEASMVNEAIWLDLLSYNIPIIAVGDQGQLPPIEGEFSLMAKPDLVLNEIHRQAKDNPIINLSILAREDGIIPVKKFSNKVIKYSKYQDLDIVDDLLSNYNSESLILCGYNNTRNKLNTSIRNRLGFESEAPMYNDRVICVRNNNKKQVFNGMLGNIKKIKSISGDWIDCEISMDELENSYSGMIYKSQFGAPVGINFTHQRSLVSKGDLFDFGYALTVHKSQGTQAKKVVLFEERFPKMDDNTWRRWLYTAVTRAQQELYIIGN